MDLVSNAAARMGIELKQSDEAIRTYIAQRSLHLSTAVNQPGFEFAVRAEAVNVMLFAAGRSVVLADAADRELFGTIIGVLGTTATLIA